MKEKQFDHLFFSEENSPVPLVPPDEAWATMRARLDAPAPVEKRRSTLLWWTPLRYAALLLLILCAGFLLWQINQDSTRESRRNQGPPASGGIVDNNDSTGRPVPAADAASTPDNEHNQEGPQQQARQHDKPPAHASEATITSDRAAVHAANEISTAASGNATDHIARTNRLITEKIMKAAIPVTASTLKDSNTLHFTQVAGTHFYASIRVQPFRYSFPGWLPEGRSMQNPSGNTPARQRGLAIGIQAELQVPLPSNNVYFKNTALKDRFYQPVIPGVWLSYVKNRHRFSAELKPFASALLPDAAYETSMDASGTRTKKTLAKVFGMQAGLGYARPVAQHWWLGGALTASFWKRGLVNKVPYPDSAFEKPVIEMVHRRSLPALQSFQPGAAVQVGYAWRDLEAMLQVEVPFTTTAKGGPLPVWTRLGLRWRVWQPRLSGASAKAVISTDRDKL
ncbi:hypothetical protein [Paraflavitalea sp. CAU 1676]|uniref:hypothetical protein n=1 Tax=Paraflavitalea sp. CAU 1676 TaxID=3032598 RepID=UPI0023DC1598|nr:hypothetical protein [Paraflavitalea sp. CAU 1676]MDF2187181.1 hypothetical protein [Paraflavitalea sp. CAU 1676]